MALRSKRQVSFAWVYRFRDEQESPLSVSARIKVKVEGFGSCCLRITDKTYRDEPDQQRCVSPTFALCPMSVIPQESP